MSNSQRNGNGAAKNGSNTNKKTNGNGRNGRNGNGNGKNTQMPAIARRTTNVPAAFSAENRRAMNNNIVTLSGSDFISTVTVAPAATVADRILNTLPVSPSAYPGTRITQLSELWERYRFKRFAFRFVPAVPVTLACQLTLYVDLDPLDDPTTITDADTLVRQAVAQTGSQEWNFNLPKTIELAKRGDDQLYYTGEDKQNLRFSQQGTGYLIQVTDPVNSEGASSTDPIVAGSIFIDWTVMFQTPQINPEAAIAIPFNVSHGQSDISGELYTDLTTLTLEPAVPNEYYICSIVGRGALIVPGSIWLRAPPGAGQAAGFYFQNENTPVSINAIASGNSVFPGYVVVRATPQGEINIQIQKTYDTETATAIITILLTYRDDVFATAANISLFTNTNSHLRMKMKSSFV